ncbi:MAG: 23S rRNA pseudouridine2605 synthase [Bradymonadia bacterium]|jgi:23S rRNA pseudouridine2605 synthase
MSRERLQKYLARAGVASRRASERLIRQGLVKVNGKIVTELGTQIDPIEDRVEFEDRQITVDARFAYLMVNKPQKVISAVTDPEGRDVINNYVPAAYGRVYPVGRLDWDSEGAILLTNDGDLTNLLTHPKNEVKKTYLAKVRGMVRDDDPSIIKIRNGVRLNDGFQTAPAEVVRDGDTGQHTWFVVVIHEGQNRQIRRMFEAVGMTVLRLRRIAFGPVLLADLSPGDYRRLTDIEVEELYEAAGGKRPVLSTSRGMLSTKHRDGKSASMKAGRRLGAAHDAGSPSRSSSEEVPADTPMASTQPKKRRSGGDQKKRDARPVPRGRAAARANKSARKPGAAASSEPRTGGRDKRKERADASKARQPSRGSGRPSKKRR